MFDAKATIREIFLRDSKLRELLPNRKSLLKAGDMSGETKMPAVTFRDGPLVPVGDRVWQQEVYVRIYDEPKNGTINIGPIGMRMKDLIHLQKFELQDGVFVEARLNNTLGELEDPAFDKTFVEYQFRVIAL